MKTSLIVIIIVFLAGAGVFWYFREPAANQGLTLNSNSQGQTFNSNWEGYAHPSLPFAFAHPKELVSNTFQDGESEIVLLQGSDPNQEIQIVARAFDEPFDPAPFDSAQDEQGKPGPLTVERIKRDLPEMVIEEPQNALIGSAQIPALLFWSSDASLGRTREVWFVYPERSRGVVSYLYQVTTKAENDDLLAGIMETWRDE